MTGNGASAGTATGWRIGAWRVYPGLNRLERGDRTVELEPKVMALLALLASRPGEPISRDALHEAIWPGTIVTDKALTAAVSKLRRAFGDDPRAPAYIETISKRGYRLLASVEPLDTTAPGVGARPSPGASGGTPKRGRRAGLRPAPAGFLAAALVVVGATGMLLAGGEDGDRFRLEVPPIPFTSSPEHEINVAVAPRGGDVAYSWPGPDADNWDIWVQRSPGAVPLRLTDDPAYEIRPVWSPAGDRIAFVRFDEEGCELRVAPALGGPSSRLVWCSEHLPPRVFFSFGIAWSPDGEWIAWPMRRAAGESKFLELLAVDGSGRRAVTAPGSGFHDDDPAFSPDGGELAFARTRGGASDVWVVDLASGQERRLTTAGRTILGLDWTPDGREILYSSNRSGDFALWRVPASGGPSTWVPAQGNQIKEPAFARDGTRLAYEDWLYDTNVWRRTLGDGEPEPTIAIESTRGDGNVAIAPDGARVAFVSDRSGAPELWLLERPDGAPRRLTTLGGAGLAAPAFSPDGEWLAFELLDGGRSDLATVASNGGPVHRLTSGDAAERFPFWDVDGGRVLFGSDRDGSWRIWSLPVVIDADGVRTDGEAKAVTPPGALVGARTAASPDLWYTRVDAPGLWRLAPGTGVPERVAEWPLPADAPSLSTTPGGVWFVGRPAGGPTLFRLDPHTGAAAPVSPLASFLLAHVRTVVVAPDERWLLETRLDQTAADIRTFELR